MEDLRPRIRVLDERERLQVVADVGLERRTGGEGLGEVSLRGGVAVRVARGKIEGAPRYAREDAETGYALQDISFSTGPGEMAGSA